MKAPKYREHIHHVRTERGVSSYQIRDGAGELANVIASVVVYDGDKVHCTTCDRNDCEHARKIRDKRLGREAGGDNA